MKPNFNRFTKVIYGLIIAAVSVTIGIRCGSKGDEARNASEDTAIVNECVIPKDDAERYDFSDSAYFERSVKRVSIALGGEEITVIKTENGALVKYQARERINWGELIERLQSDEYVYNFVAYGRPATLFLEKTLDSKEWMDFVTSIYKLRMHEWEKEYPELRKGFGWSGAYLIAEIIFADKKPFRLKELPSTGSEPSSLLRDIMEDIVSKVKAER